MMDARELIEAIVNMEWPGPESTLIEPTIDAGTYSDEVAPCITSLRFDRTA